MDSLITGNLSWLQVTKFTLVGKKNYFYRELIFIAHSRVVPRIFIFLRFIFERHGREYNLLVKRNANNAFAFFKIFHRVVSLILIFHREENRLTCITTVEYKCFESNSKNTKCSQDKWTVVRCPIIIFTLVNYCS